jgi:hypothetical protein
MTSPKLVLECTGFSVRSLPDGRLELELDNASGEAKPPEDTLYDKAGVAARLGVTVRSVENWMKKKRHPLPYLKHCGRPRFRESDVAWWLSQTCTNRSRRLS